MQQLQQLVIQILRLPEVVADITAEADTMVAEVVTVVVVIGEAAVVVIGMVVAAITGAAVIGILAGITAIEITITVHGEVVHPTTIPIATIITTPILIRTTITTPMTAVTTIIQVPVPASTSNSADRLGHVITLSYDNETQELIKAPDFFYWKLG